MLRLCPDFRRQSGKSRALNGTPQQRAGFADEASYTNATPDSLAADVAAHAQDWDWAKRASCSHRGRC
jgi:hypothetical protein